MFLGDRQIDDTLIWTTLTMKKGVLTDADSDPTYRIYEDETATPIVTGTMAKLDDANTTGFYSEAVQLTSASGFERGKNYNIYVEATVASKITGTLRHFQIGANATDVVVKGTVDTAGFTPTTTQFEADDITEATADHYKDRVIIFKSGALRDQAKDITAYALVAGRGRFTTSAWTEAAGNNDEFIIV